MILGTQVEFQHESNKIPLLSFRHLIMRCCGVVRGRRPGQDALAVTHRPGSNSRLELTEPPRPNQQVNFLTPTLLLFKVEVSE